jgi:hypothetical protein
MTGVRVACYARVMAKLSEWQTLVDVAACYGSLPVLIHDMKREHWATGGKLWSDE